MVNRSKDFPLIDIGLEDLSDQNSAGKVDRDFIRCLTKNYQKIFAYIVTFVPNRQDAEDLMQETSVQIWGKFREFDQSLDFYRWAVGFARNNVRQYNRRRKPAHMVLGGFNFEMQLFLG